MKLRRFCAVFCAAALAAGLLAPARAAGRYPDLPRDHWAYSYMDKAAELKILLGMGGGNMAPDGPLTWAQCLTIAARAFAPEVYAAAQGESWELAGYNACVEAGFLLPPEEEFLDVSAEPDSLGRPISRQDTAALLARAIPGDVTGRRVEYDWETGSSATLTALETLSDYYLIPATHWEAVDRLFDLEIVQGSPVEAEGNTYYFFNGGETLRRADGATLFIRALNRVDSARRGEEKTVTLHVVDGQGAALLDDRTVETQVGALLSETLSEEAALHYYTLYPEDMDDASFRWELPVSTACAEYTLVYYPMNEMERARQDFFDAVLRGELTYGDYWWQPFNRYEMGENDYKHLLLFGEQDKRRYANQTEAAAHQVTVTVPLWKLNRQGEKYASKGSFSINAAIAEDVVNLFTEIFNDPEQFPIKDVGGYSWRGDSATGEHNCGTAIDINASENYQIRGGNVLVGTCWSPGENPYSIDPNGSVVRIFAKYGWSWGGDAWAIDADPSTGYHDYMHFSYMGG